MRRRNLVTSKPLVEQHHCWLCFCEKSEQYFIFLLQWLVMRFAAINLELIHAAVQTAKRDGVLVSLDLASFEVCCLISFFPLLAS